MILISQLASACGWWVLAGWVRRATLPPPTHPHPIPTVITLFGTCTTFNWTDAVDSPKAETGMVYVAGANPLLYALSGGFPPILMVLVGFAFFSVNRARSAWNSIAGTLITYSLVLQWGQLCYGFFDLCQTVRVCEGGVPTRA